MTSNFYIPPEGLRFRIVGYASQRAIFSRTTQTPNVWHYSISFGVFSDQWFTLLHGTGNRAGRYAIRGQASGRVLYSRHQAPSVGHVEGNGLHEDNWFQIVPGSGQYTNFFNLITPSQGLALYSRSAPEPTFSNYTPNSSFTSQLFYFVWEDMRVDRVDFNLGAGVIGSSTPIVLVDQVLTNDTDTEQEMSFSINKGVAHSSTFEYSTGFTVTLGMEFSVGIPVISQGTLTVETSSTNTWTWGSTTEYSRQYTATFPARAAPRTSVRATSVVNRGTLDVPYTMHLSSRSTGVRVQTTGTWRGVSSWDLRHSITTLDPHT